MDVSLITSAWRSFSALKTWQKIAIAFLLLVVASSPFAQVATPESAIASAKVQISEDNLDVAWELVDEALRLDVTNADLLALQGTITQIQSSKRAYSEAIKLESGKDFESSLMKFLEVSSKDLVRFNDATTHISKNIENLISGDTAVPVVAPRDSVLEQVAAVIASKRLDLSRLNIAIAARHKAYVEQIITSVQKMISLKQYSEAEELLVAAENLAFRSNDKIWSAESKQVLQSFRSEGQKLSDIIDQQIRAARAAILSKMTKKVDDFTNTTWYYDRATYSTYAGNRFFLYIGKKSGGSTWLRLYLEYYGEDWVFWDTATINADGQIFTLSPGFSDVKRDNSGGAVWEWYDISPTAYELEIVRAVAAAKKAVVRYEGDTFRADRTISSAQKQALRNVLAAYDALQ